MIKKKDGLLKNPPPQKKGKQTNKQKVVITRLVIELHTRAWGEGTFSGAKITLIDLNIFFSTK